VAKRCLPNQNPEVDLVSISAKSSADGKINLKTSNVTQFLQIQKKFLTNNIGFHTHTLATDRQLKVVLKGIPIEISDVDLKNGHSPKALSGQSLPVISIPSICCGTAALPTLWVQHCTTTCSIMMTRSLPLLLRLTILTANLTGLMCLISPS